MGMLGCTPRLHRGIADGFEFRILHKNEIGYNNSFKPKTFEKGLNWEIL